MGRQGIGIALDKGRTSWPPVTRGENDDILKAMRTAVNRYKYRANEAPQKIGPKVVLKIEDYCDRKLQASGSASGSSNSNQSMSGSESSNHFIAEVKARTRQKAFRPHAHSFHGMTSRMKLGAVKIPELLKVESKIDRKLDHLEKLDQLEDCEAEPSPRSGISSRVFDYLGVDPLPLRDISPNVSTMQVESPRLPIPGLSVSFGSDAAAWSFVSKLREILHRPPASTQALERLFARHVRSLTNVPLALCRLRVSWEQVLKDLDRESLIMNGEKVHALEGVRAIREACSAYVGSAKLGDALATKVCRLCCRTLAGGDAYYAVLRLFGNQQQVLVTTSDYGRGLPEAPLRLDLEEVLIRSPGPGGLDSASRGDFDSRDESERRGLHIEVKIESYFDLHLGNAFLCNRQSTGNDSLSETNCSSALLPHSALRPHDCVVVKASMNEVLTTPLADEEMAAGADDRDFVSAARTSQSRSLSIMLVTQPAGQLA